MKKINEDMAVEAMKMLLREATTTRFRGKPKEPELWQMEGQFGIYLSYKGRKNFIICYDMALVYRNHGFCKDFRARSKEAKYFRNITLMLLHELGHLETKGRIPKKYDHFAEMEKIYNRTSKRFCEEFNCPDSFELQELINENPALHKAWYDTLNVEYRKLPDEMMATNWAIEWLKDPAHRKLCKKFEAQFAAAEAEL